MCGADLRRRSFLAAGLALTALALGLSARAQDPDPRVLQAEAQRIAVIEKVKPTVVAIFSRNGQGGGSGVLITRDGYALTNYHVVQGSGPVMQCGLPDGVLYDAVLVGLDKVGDVALIKLLPKQEDRDFPCAVLGDSDKVKPGDWSLAMGNPFLLATDFTPTITFGLVSGVHRYQYPAGVLLEYTDCIQIDTSINPGNSGGPLFNLDGELIGINGRGSFEKRGRVNSGVGYAISLNQIKNFLGQLRAGLDTDHASLGALVKEGEAGTRMVVTSILENSDAHRRGLDIDDELVSFAGRPMSSVNQYKNVLGLFPKGWRVPLVYRRDNEKYEILVRLMGVQRQEIENGRPRPPEPPPERPERPDRPGRPGRPPASKPDPDSPAAKLFEPKPGFANFYFNKQERDRLWNGFRKHGDFSTVAGTWTVEADLQLKQNRLDSRLVVLDEPDKDSKTIRTLSRLTLGGVKYELDPLQAGQNIRNLKDPPGSGGLAMALYQYRRLLTLGEKGFEGQFSHGGVEPFYPPPPDGQKPESWADVRIDTEVLRTEHAAIPAKWHFSPENHSLLGFEVSVDADEDPCEVYLSDYRPADGRMLPHRIEVRYGNGVFGTFTVKSYQLAAAKEAAP
jgi:S1-C subfamily serine protease